MQPTKMQIQQTTSYKDKIRIRFRQQINQIVNKHSLPELVIVLDTVSAFLLSNVFSINDLVAMKIIYIQKLDRKRKKLDKHALYFITPTKNNIDCLIRDFPVLQQNQVPQYRRIHILFTTFIDPPTLRQLAIHKGLLKRIAKNSIKQFYFSARILAGNLVDMNIPYLGCAYSKQSQEQEIRRQLICRKIVQFIANHNSINTVRVFYKKSANKVCQRLANSLETIIKNYLGILLQNRSPYLSKSAPDLTILLLDRSIDTVTPFIHSFTYQALLFDFFPISMVTKSDLEDKGAYSYEQIQNSVYDEFRYQHVSEALSKIPQSLQNQKGKLQSLKTIGNDKIDIRQLTQRIGEYKANIQRLQAIWKQFQNQKMQDIADLQQSIATGITSNSENTSSTKLIQDVITLCKNPNITREQKLRLGILVISCIKTSKEDYEMLLEQFGNDDKKILKNMIALGASYDGTITKSTKTVTKDQQKIAEKRMQTTGMHLNRYTSIVELVIPLFCKILSDPVHSQTIDKQVFGQVVCSIFKTGEEQINFKQNRFALAMIGGMSWSEVSAIRMMQQLNDIVIMADSVMNANQFLKEIAKINIVGY